MNSAAPFKVGSLILSSSLPTKENKAIKTSKPIMSSP